MSEWTERWDRENTVATEPQRVPENFVPWSEVSSEPWRLEDGPPLGMAKLMCERTKAMGFDLERYAVWVLEGWQGWFIVSTEPAAEAAWHRDGPKPR